MALTGDPAAGTEVLHVTRVDMIEIVTRLTTCTLG